MPIIYNRFIAKHIWTILWCLCSAHLAVVTFLRSHHKRAVKGNDRGQMYNLLWLSEVRRQQWEICCEDPLLTDRQRCGWYRQEFIISIVPILKSNPVSSLIYNITGQGYIRSLGREQQTYWCGFSKTKADAKGSMTYSSQVSWFVFMVIYVTF